MNRSPLVTGTRTGAMRAPRPARGPARAAALLLVAGAAACGEPVHVRLVPVRDSGMEQRCLTPPGSQVPGSIILVQRCLTPIATYRRRRAARMVPSSREPRMRVTKR